ncbi:MAG: hypothetical protein Q4F61_03300 [Candidatus Saccharibacteria bacterium]|nr:hypothetical protein [Candidatus Saccharibacteria bacterium]
MEQKGRVIFYSWQSNDKKSKNFIEKSLKNAIKSLENDPVLESRPILDDSTKGKIGAVDIPATITEKIDNCDVFVADLSFIAEYNNRKFVNQNVLYELGYMIGKRTADRVIMLFNSDSGEIRDLPFDISHRRVMPFSIKNDKKGEQLTSSLVNLLSVYLQNAELWEQLPKTDEIGLDAEELDIMKFFATIEDDKRVLVTRTMSGFLIQAANICDNDLLSSLIENQGENKFVANLDDLADKGVLKLIHSKKGTPNYELTKLGYNIIEKL